MNDKANREKYKLAKYKQTVATDNGCTVGLPTSL